jgi:hypothetical protein
MTYHHKDGMIYDSEDGQTIATMSESATPEQAALLAAADSLLDALFTALPFVEDHEGSDIYKPRAVAQALAKIRAAIQEASI